MPKIIETLKKSAFFTSMFLATFVFIIIKSMADLDLWHRMAVGKIFSTTGWIIHHDIFSYMPTKDMWIDHEWLSGVIFYYLTYYLGDWGILGLQILLTFLILFLIYRTNKLIFPENQYRIVFYIIALIAILPGAASTIRCQVFTYLFFTLWIYLLEKTRRGDRRFIWIFPVTMLFWANMHGGFLAGIGLIGFYIIGDFLNKKDVKIYFLLLALILPVTLINPYGITYWDYIIDAVLMERPYITEWQAFNPFRSFYTGLGYKILLGILLIGYGYRILAKNYRFDRVELVTLLIIFALSIKHERHSTFFVIAAAVFGYQHFAAFISAIFAKLPEHRLKRLYFVRDYGVYFFMIITCIYILQTTPISIKMDYYPLKAIEFVRINGLSGNILVPFNWSSYALWKLYPKCLVAIDGRYEETYKSQSYLDICHLTFFEENWKNTLDNYHHDILLLDVKSDIFKKIKTLNNWKLVYEDEKAGIFLPADYKTLKWKMPVKDVDYYTRKKYKTAIQEESL